MQHTAKFSFPAKMWQFPAYSSLHDILYCFDKSFHVNIEHRSLLYFGFCVSSADAILRAELIVSSLFDLPHLKVFG